MLLAGLQEHVRHPVSTPPDERQRRAGHAGLTWSASNDFARLFSLRNCRMILITLRRAAQRAFSLLLAAHRGLGATRPVMARRAASWALGGQRTHSVASISSDILL
jgi:hypothetical protein